MAEQTVTNSAGQKVTTNYTPESAPPEVYKQSVKTNYTPKQEDEQEQHQIVRQEREDTRHETNERRQAGIAERKRLTEQKERERENKRKEFMDKRMEMIKEKKKRSIERGAQAVKKEQEREEQIEKEKNPNDRPGLRPTQPPSNKMQPLRSFLFHKAAGGVKAGAAKAGTFVGKKVKQSATDFMAPQSPQSTRNRRASQRQQKSSMGEELGFMDNFWAKPVQKGKSRKQPTGLLDSLGTVAPRSSSQFLFGAQAPIKKSRKGKKRRSQPQTQRRDPWDLLW